MPFPYDRYPWLNFQELNLAYFIRHFQEIFEQWTQLLADQEAWKAATEQDIEDWKTDTLGALDVWKAEAETSIEGWESTTLAALTAWQTAAEAAFEAIRVQAAASATAAAGSATAAQTAQTAAEAAQAAAETAAAEITDAARLIQNTNAGLYGMAESKTQRGPTVNFMDGSAGTDPIEFKAKILPTQSGSGTPSSGNVRPFTARTQLSVCVSPRNMCRIRSAATTTSGITVTPNGDGTVKFRGTASSTGGPVVAYVYLHEGDEYYCEFDYSSGNWYPRIDPPNAARIFPASGSVFTAPESGEYYIRMVVNSGKTYSKDSVIPYLCLANSSHTKTPATGSNRALVFPETPAVYAGELTYTYGGKCSLAVYPYYASYNGETLAGEWASSMDAYAPGTTPTVGAEVVDLSGAVAQTITFDSANLLTLFGGENVLDTNPTNSAIIYAAYAANVGLSKTNHYDIPDYYRINNYMDGKMSDIRAAVLASGGNYDSFIWITDCHWGLNAKHSPALIKYITDRIPIPRVFFGGDLGEGINLNALGAYKAAIGARIYNTIGNHEYHNDFTDFNRNTASFTIKDPYLWQYYNSGMIDAVIGDAGRNYYYVDNPVQKMRYIILNVYSEGTVAAFETEQQNWLADTALDLPAGYTAVVIAHQVAYPNHSTGELSFNYTVASPYIQTIVDTAAAASVKIAGIFCGHAHFDGLGRTAGGVPVIVTTCDKYKPSPGYDDWLADTRFVDTITEQAFDVVIIDKTNEKITAVRIGCPADNPTGSPLETRSITYGE